MNKNTTRSYLRNCEYCADPFTANGPRAKFCPKCRKNRYKKPEPLEEREKAAMTSPGVDSQQARSVQ